MDNIKIIYIYIYADSIQDTLPHYFQSNLLFNVYFIINLYFFCALEVRSESDSYKYNNITQFTWSELYIDNSKYYIRHHHRHKLIRPNSYNIIKYFIIIIFYLFMQLNIY